MKEKKGDSRNEKKTIFSTTKWWRKWKLRNRRWKNLKNVTKKENKDEKEQVDWHETRYFWSSPQLN